MTPDSSTVSRVSGASEALAGDVVVSSRVRLARNLRGKAFPGWAGSHEREHVFSQMSRILTAESLLENPSVLQMDELNLIERDILCEKHLISAELTLGGSGTGVVYDRCAGLSVMINEEDHLRMQVLHAGLDLQQAWQVIDQLDDRVGHAIDYAFSPSLGFLTACPSNVGTGMRASVMMHLPGLKLLGEADPVVQGLTRTGFAVRGAFGEGSDAFGALYQVSNQTTLGRSEQQTIERLDDMVRSLIDIERNARRRLYALPVPRLADHVGRVFGILQYACMLSAGEAMDIISGLRLGLDFDMVSGTDAECLMAVMQNVQPGHLQQEARRSLLAAERDVFRAGYLRGALTQVKRTGNV
ncbi:MAG TPA: ATP--guanido phosphotransferase [Verrucomicrobia bacterium]|nr:ATP--guanido phosphotransferase [Verrucomicrobiota bacterium]